MCTCLIVPIDLCAGGRVSDAAAGQHTEAGGVAAGLHRLPRRRRHDRLAEKGSYRRPLLTQIHSCQCQILGPDLKEHDTTVNEKSEFLQCALMTLCR